MSALALDNLVKSYDDRSAAAVADVSLENRARANS